MKKIFIAVLSFLFFTNVGSIHDKFNEILKTQRLFR